jgi:dienelactone hydrolase
MKKLTGLAVLLCLFSALAQAEVRTEEVTYKDNGTELKGYLAYDDAVKGKRPGILVVHEWWGHNAYARKRARMLAELGYTALAVDMYGDGKTADHPDDAGKFAKAVGGNLPLAKARFLAALNLLTTHGTVDKNKTAAIGYCFGGGMVLQMARQGIDLDGVVSFHGSVATSTPAEKGKIKARVLVYNGADDPFVTAEQIAAFKKEMADAAVDYEFVNIPGARHSFTNPEADDFAKKFNMPLAYDKSADDMSWQGMQDFFKKIFK